MSTSEIEGTSQEQVSNQVPPPGYMLYVGTYALEDPTRAALVFAAARAAAVFAKAQQPPVPLPVVTLLGEGVWLMNRAIADETITGRRGVLTDLIQAAAAEGVQIFC
jgi:hypothetical protein